MPRQKNEDVEAAPLAAKTVEQHALDAGIGPGSKDAWRFAAAQAMHRWPQGKELSAEEFAAAVVAATTAAIR